MPQLARKGHFRLAASNRRGILSSMASLNEVITALRREIDAALAENALPNGQMRLEPERVALSLEVSVREQHAPDRPVELSFVVLEAGAPAESGHTHRLTLEFKPIPLSPNQGAV